MFLEELRDLLHESLYVRYLVLNATNLNTESMKDIRMEYSGNTSLFCTSIENQINNFTKSLTCQINILMQDNLQARVNEI